MSDNLDKNPHRQRIQLVVESSRVSQLQFFEALLIFFQLRFSNNHLLLDLERPTDRCPLGVEIVIVEVVVKLFNQLIVRHGFVDHFLMLVDLVRNRFHPFAHFSQLFDRVRLLVELARDRFELFTRIIRLSAELSCQEIEYCVPKSLPLFAKTLTNILGEHKEGPDRDVRWNEVFDLVPLEQMHFHLRLDFRGRVVLSLVRPKESEASVRGERGRKKKGFRNFYTDLDLRIFQILVRSR